MAQVAVIHPFEIPDSRPLTTTFIPSTDENTAHTLVLLPGPAVPPPVGPVIEPPVALSDNPEVVRFRDERVMPVWWRLRPNLPLDPAPALAEHADPALCTVELRITTPDTMMARGAVVTRFVHPEMAGDFIRAGWGRVA